ncbi:MAG: 16S rRNA (guanine(527)-N(7))-methyltransferase RsmG [Clostridia bacterium]|nr:16S rRNA (guanine(527)-N(7))-methyltransferase RsmG [Clostridia bacterium]
MDAQTILGRLKACGIPADERIAQGLCTYHALLMDWNTRMDLTAVTEENEMLDKHYIDSLMPLTLGDILPREGSIIDVGTGAGFPGMALAIALPTARFTLLDSQQKRLNFLQEVIDSLHLTNVSLVHARAEDGAHTKALRESFDLAVARAVAPLPVLAEYLLPYVRIGGSALCWKGPSVEDELAQARTSVHLLGGKLCPGLPYTIPGRDWDHRLIPISKVAGTSAKYPRKAGTPSKSPLGTP